MDKVMCEIVGHIWVDPEIVVNTVGDPTTYYRCSRCRQKALYVHDRQPTPKVSDEQCIMRGSRT